MGAIHNEFEDEKAVIILQELPAPARIWIRHHFRSSVQAVMLGAECGRKDMILTAVIHMIEDLDGIGC